MLTELQNLRSSLNADQEKLLRNVLSEDLAKQFFSANDETTAVAAAQAMYQFLMAKPLAALGLYRSLSPEQRAFISNLAIDEDEK